MEGLAGLLISLVRRAAADGALPDLPASPSEEELMLLYRFAKAQDLAHLLSAPLAELGILPESGEVREKLDRVTFAAVYRAERTSYELSAICGALSDAGIAHIPLKGAVIRELYPEPWMRTSSDIDVLVRPEDADRACEALTAALGYRNDGVAEHDVQLMTPSGLHVELHFETIEEYHLAAAHRVLSRIWEHAIPREEGGFTYRLDGAMFYFYHIAHMAKHLRRAGSGARSLLDLWLIRRHVEIDPDVLAGLLAEGDLAALAETAERLADAWFSGAEQNASSERLGRYVLNGGIYGSRDNSIAMDNVKHGRFGSMMRLIFLPYRNMCIKYPSLARHKLALPFYHLYRWGSLVFRGRVRSSVGILRKNMRIGAEMGDDVRIMMQELHLDAAEC